MVVKMKEKILRKLLVCGIIILFIGAGAATGINGKINRNDIDEKTLDNSLVIPNQNVCSLKFYTFDKTDEKQNNANLQTEVANNIYTKLEELKYMIVHEPRSDETQNLKNEFVDLLDSYGLIPVGLTKNYILSLLNPSWLKNKQKTTKTKTILSKNYMSPIAEKIVNLQQTFKNSFGKTVLNIFDKNTIISPSGKTTATASFCSVSSGGSGTTLPIFLLPRPRAIAAWTAPGAFTSVGELLALKGFIAEGAQSGSMFGFTGIGFTFSFPGEIFYGFIGYALYTKVSADYIEFYPPNQVPVISDENPPSGSVDIPLSLSKLSFRLSDADGDLMDYTVTTEPNIGSGSGNNKKNGVYTIPISGLEWDKSYKWKVKVTEGKSIVEKVFIFVTVSRPFDPFDEGWQYCKKITIDYTKVAGDLINFPVLISVVDPDLRNKAQDDGDDILFMDGSGVAKKLFHEFEQFDGSSGELVAWVKIPSLSSSVDTIFYIYYGNPNCSNQDFPELVWDTNYKGIWHLGEGGMGIRHDSTICNNDGTPENYDGDEATIGKVEGADNFDGDDSDYGDNIVIPHDSSLDGYTEWTFEGWCKLDSFGGDTHEDRIFDKDERYAFALEDSGENEHIAIWVGGSFFDSKDLDFTTGIWYYISVTADGESGKYYVDGLYKDSNTFNLMTGGSGVLRIGSYCYYENLDGIIDEVRISNTVRSSGWISTTFNSINNPTSFLSFGPEEASP
jgi:hypothetical protein